MKNNPQFNSTDALFLEMSESLDPFIKFASGYRIKLENEGFSPAAAEQVAASMLVSLQTKAIQG